jgi:DNA-binding NtrC family response regulator
LCDRADGFEADSDPFLVVNILGTEVRALLATGRTFDAGQRARAGVEWADRAGDGLVQVVAGTAHMRVLAAAGDLDLVAERKGRIIALAKGMHAPLRALRVRVIWARTLQRAGRPQDAATELRRLTRASKAVPRLLGRSIEELRVGTRRESAVTCDGVPLAMALLRVSQHEEDDRAAARAVLDRFASESRAARVELQSAAGGALSTIAVSGGGLVPQLGGRSLESGIIVGPECVAGAWEIAAPMRSGGRLLGAIACRWPLGRAAHPRASEWLELATAILAPRMELLLAERADAARAAVEIPELIGVSAEMGDVRRAIARASTAPFAVLVEGESGSGKELVARAIHHLSARRDRRFCDVNCAALPDDLLESELFGHAKGAFTGALVERAGLFEEAHGGTLFLDELPDLSLRAQAKLLRVLQQGEIRRVGESFTRRVDVRLVTATNRSMAQEVGDGRFRQDLLYRLDVIRIRIPPLRERPDDVPVLARHFWTIAAGRASTRAVLSHAALAELARYHWPGNVRELQNVMSALAVAAPSRGVVRPTLLPPAITGALSVSSARLQDARQQFERRFIEVALARASGSRTRAAAQLGISRQGLLKLMSRLGVADT